MISFGLYDQIGMSWPIPNHSLPKYSFAYCYQLFNVLSSSGSHSDHIKQCLLNPHVIVLQLNWFKTQNFTCCGLNWHFIISNCVMLKYYHWKCCHLVHVIKLTRIHEQASIHTFSVMHVSSSFPFWYHLVNVINWHR